MQRKYLFNISFLLSLLLLVGACKEEEYAIPTLRSEFQNDCIKRNLGPNLIGNKMEFAYAMALPPNRGRILSAQVEASIAGAPGTYLENRSFHTDASRVDIGVPIGEPAQTAGKVTRVDFTADTSAATLRYYYVIPDEARGQQVSFTFSASSSTGENVSYTMGPYDISRMDIALDLNVKDGETSYISIADMAVYDATAAAANADKIDLVYLYRALPNISFAHALVAPAADPQYLPEVTLPAGVNKNTRLRKAWGLRDQQLARLQFGIFIDDLDFQQIDLSDAPNYGINMRAESGAWVETADGRYRAYIFINAVDNANKSARISIKRYAL
ncbi:DUF4466 family protein [Pontibacter beigongshangensis]|uniref:DUF4466 family protein n=1 Tax=Pontibacter beigongshangensis TaxID=2574733 RepID=UPI0016503BFA|nr:DUF4466 family protein [Pontibacter beigongshangensis]